MTEAEILLGEPARPKPIRMNIGHVSLEFEPDSGWIRYVRVGDREILRAVYVTARFGDWGTPPTSVTNVSIDSSDEGFCITYDATTAPHLPFRWQGVIEGDESGISYRLTGLAEAEFMTNRTGLCVLHPASLRGEPVTIGHSDGSSESGHFPTTILPVCPFTDVRSLAYGGSVVAFDGDVFETEDQRNWLDASFKTYSRLQSMPKPSPLAAGTRVDQEVYIEIGKQSTESRETVETFLVPEIAVAGEPRGILHVTRDDGDSVRVGETRMDLVSRANLTELNTNRPSQRVSHAMFALNPQTHAFDWRTIIESLEVIGDSVETARLFADHVHVGPVTLDGQDRDRRWNSFLAMSWIVAVVGMLTRAGADSITFSRRLADSPTSVLIDDLGLLMGQRIEVRHGRHPLDHIRLESPTMILVANLSLESKVIHLPAGRVRVLGDDGSPRWQEFVGGGFTLRPCATVRLDR